MTDTMHDADPKTRPRQRWAQTARWSGIAIVVWAIVTHLIARVPVPPVVVIGVVFGAFVPFLNARRRTLGLVLGILGGLALVANLQAVIPELARPESAPEPSSVGG